MEIGTMPTFAIRLDMGRILEDIQDIPSYQIALSVLLSRLEGRTIIITHEEYEEATKDRPLLAFDIPDEETLIVSLVDREVLTPEQRN
jgi:hypothetical protein